jgi:hypothetical protein
MFGHSMTMTVVKTIGQCFLLVAIISLMAKLIRRKRAGQWKRPWTFPIAMTLLGISLVSYSAAMVLRFLGK